MSSGLPNIQACVFDAYGTLFDVNSAARSAEDALGEKWQPLAELWRAKQLQYTWLRGLAGHHADFWQVTGDALDFALSTLNIADSELRARILKLSAHRIRDAIVDGDVIGLRHEQLWIAPCLSAVE